MKSIISPLHLLTLKTMGRKKVVCLLIALTMALGSFACIMLHNLTIRQKSMISEMIAETEINCIVTDANGMNSNNLHMFSVFVDMLMGHRIDQGCQLSEYVSNVRAVSTSPLMYPEETTLRKILSLDSDPTLSTLEGVHIKMDEGWTEDIFQTSNPVCLISEGMVTDGTRTLTIQQAEQVPQELTIIGTVYNGNPNTIYCPFYLEWPDGFTHVISVESCSFSIRDNTRLEESKTNIYETFVEPSLDNLMDGLTYGVLIQDEVYLSTLDELNSNLRMLDLMLPILIVLYCCIGFFTSYLTIRGRTREFAVMRCLGMKRSRIFCLVFEELFVLTVLGCSLGTLCGWFLDKSITVDATAKVVIVTSVFLLGAAMATIQVTSVNVMKLMKAED